MIFSSEDRPEQFDYFQSTSQGFYSITEIFINGNPIEANDWVGAFNGDICVGSRKWDTAECGGGICDVPVMGVDGTSNTIGYMNTGDIPTFKVFDSSEQIFLDMDFYNHHPYSEDVSWHNFAIKPLDQLINVDYSFSNSSDFENTATVSSIFSDDIYEMGPNDILTAYSGDEIRGVSIAINNDIANGSIFFCSIFLDQIIEECKFKYYNYENKLIFDLDQSLALNADDSFGSALNPYVFSIKDDELDISNENMLPDYSSIIEVYPNPFNPIININLNVVNSDYLDIGIFDVNGKKIYEIFEGYKHFGKYQYRWDAAHFSSGIYYVVSKNSDNKEIVSQKICLIK